MDEPSPEPPVETPVERAVERAPRIRRVFAWLVRNAYLVVIAAAVLVLTRAIEFSPPPEVRVGNADVGQLIGDAPPQEFSQELANPQAVQVRATLRLYPDPELPVSSPDPDTDEQGKILSQPVVTTILGMNASIDQTVRLDGGELEVELSLEATPRMQGVRKRGGPPPELVLEHEIVVKSRADSWWRNRPLERVHLDARGFLGKVAEQGYRIVFTVDEHLFSLDLEISHAAAATAPSLARTGT